MFFNHCRCLGHTESRCWNKFPNLNPHNKNDSDFKPSFLANADDEDVAVCRMTNQAVPCEFESKNNSLEFGLMSKYANMNDPTNSGKCFVDSGFSSHMVIIKLCFHLRFKVLTILLILQTTMQPMFPARVLSKSIDLALETLQNANSPMFSMFRSSDTNSCHH